MSSSCDFRAGDGQNRTILPQWQAALNQDLTQRVRLADNFAGLDQVKSGLPVAQWATTAPLPTPGEGSRLQQLLVSLGYPLARRSQERFARDSAMAMLRAAKSANRDTGLDA